MEYYKKLINEVKKYKLLYDRFHEDYTNEEKKKLVWENIGFSTDMTGERAKKKWDNIHSAYMSRKKSFGKHSDLLDFLEPEGNKISSPFKETSSTSILESPKKMNLDEQISTPKSKKRKRGDKFYAEEVEQNQTDFCGSPPINISNTSVFGQDDIDSFCQLIAVRMKTLPDPQVKSIKRQILEILHKSEIESL